MGIPGGTSGDTDMGEAGEEKKGHFLMEKAYRGVGWLVFTAGAIPGKLLV